MFELRLGAVCALRVTQRATALQSAHRSGGFGTFARANWMHAVTETCVRVPARMRKREGPARSADSYGTDRQSRSGARSLRSSRGLVIPGTSSRASQEGDGGASCRAQDGDSGQCRRVMRWSGSVRPARSHAAAYSMLVSRAPVRSQKSSSLTKARRPRTRVRTAPRSPSTAGLRRTGCHGGSGSGT